MLPHFNSEIRDSIISNGYELIFECKDSFDKKKISTTIEHLKWKLIEQKLERASCKRVFGCIVESLENAFRHSSEQNECLENNVNLIINLLKYGNNFKLIVGNFLSKDQCVTLTNRFNNIVKLEKFEIQEHCIEIMKHGCIDHKGGGGLGILDIAIRSEGNIITKYFPAENNQNFFVLEATIDTKKLASLN